MVYSVDVYAPHFGIFTRTKERFTHFFTPLIIIIIILFLFLVLIFHHGFNMGVDHDTRFSWAF